ncbi:PAS domain-containing hybrid sensor histidine kinase/response regulator [Solimicrobium silvestre]|uniref:histidine kinase n=1 Tax=Solimicrobium silvestre TaxID=2099400 RepID=A0A2S9GUP4_9BURK|nr:PAS domain-containing hybrid sensor histidine kinase/response regulator [Solimicrobium silvestre]PRC91455.1 PAS domain S-box protein [Solimicrobium silvestre]
MNLENGIPNPDEKVKNLELFPEGSNAAAAYLLQRQHAEARLQQHAALSQEEVTILSPEVSRHLLHELRVHQIELEMQNEELRESQVALDAARDRYFDLYDLAPVGYCTISEKGLIRQANLAAASLFGVMRGTLLKQPLSRFISRENQDTYYLHRKKLVETGEPQSFEMQMVKEDATPFWAHLTMTIAQDADGAAELRVVLNDVTERKHAEDERALLQQDLQDKNAELERARVVAEKANQAKSDFLSNMSHELRTPLHAILGFAQLLGTGAPVNSTPLTLDQQQSVDQILKAGWHLLELVNDILDLAVIEAGKIGLSIEAVSLTEIIRECKAMAAPLAQRRGIEIIFPSEEICCFAQVDRIRIKQVLINLLSNAIKYNRPNGTVTLTVKSGVNSERSIRICVADTGAGLRQDELLQLFQPFNRLGQDMNAEEGTGIGLVVCKRLIELMSGTIGVESIVGKGSVFWIELALVDSPDNIKPLQINTENIAQLVTKSHTLLYVEDNLANLKLVEAIIARQPHIRLLSAPNGNSGIVMARDFLPDIILMDIDLPDISGFTVLKMLAEDATTAHIPVIALSANAMPHNIEQGLKAGFFQYMTKPIKIDELMKTLNKATDNTFGN